MTVGLHWFRRDLRLHDNPALQAAISRSTTSYAVFAEDELAQLNERQRLFATAALRHLASTLGKSDATLSILTGEPVAALAAVARRLHATTVYAARSFDRRERALERDAARTLSHEGIELVLIGAPVVHEPEAVDERKQAPGKGYRVFPAFWQAWKALPVERPLEAAATSGRDPQAGALPDVAPPPYAPDPREASARDALTRFVTARAGDYGVNAQYPGRAATSLLAAYLRFGVLSPRAVHHAIAEKMARSWTLAQERISMEAFVRRLALRDFYIHLAYFQPDMRDEPLQTKMRGFGWSRDERLVEAWRSGMTGYPLVDAAMRQLGREGHVHERAAVVAASFLSADLGVDWRIGRDVWMERLLEGDEALCVGNWQRIAGIGSDQAAYPRIYNPVRQAQLLDAQATYVRRWCTELAKLPSRAALAPWEIGAQAQIELGFYTPQQYPARIVDHDTAAREFLTRYQAYRNRAS